MKKEKSEFMKVKWPQKNPQKQGRILEGGGKNFSGLPEYIPLVPYDFGINLRYDFVKSILVFFLTSISLNNLDPMDTQILFFWIERKYPIFIS